MSGRCLIIASLAVMIALSCENGHYSHDQVSTFYGIDSFKDDVYLLYSGNRFWGDDPLPTYECRHLIVYGWDGTPKRRYLLDRSVNSVAIRDDKVIGCTSIPKSQILVFDLPDSAD